MLSNNPATDSVSDISASSSHPLLMPAASTAALRSKRVVDVALAAMGLMVLFVLFAIIAIAIAASDRGPVLIRHRRIGKDGVSFPCLKFRTMVTDADRALEQHLAENPAARVEWRETRKLKNDPRVTPLGRVLRDTSLDELPQLINILRGDMSIVGPRPIVADEAVRYGGAIAYYKAVRPGLTGLWQCSGRNDVGYEQRVMLDTRYVQTWSLTQDFAIIIKTIPAVLLSRGVY